MGVVKRQGLYSSLFMYAGLVLGMISSVFLFPTFLGPEVYGFVNWLTMVSSILMIISTLGLQSTVVRYMPYLRTADGKNQGFISFLVGGTTIGAIITVALSLLFKKDIISLFPSEDGGEYVLTYYYLLPVTLVLMTYRSLLCSITMAVMRPRIHVFMMEIVERGLLLVFLILVITHLISLEAFILLFTSKFAITVVVLVFFLWHINEFKLLQKPTFLRQPIFRDMSKYSGYALLTTSGGTMISTIDGIMVGSMESILNLGIYLPFYYMARVIIMPHNGIAKITNPMIANAWQQNDLEAINKLYKRTAINNLAAGLLIFIGIWANIDNALMLLPEGYEAGKNVALYLGLSQIFHILNGYNGNILVNSNKYRFELLSKLFAVILTVITNYFFIRAYGLVGAAMATALTYAISNLINQAFVYYHFRIHPFSLSTLYILILGTVVMFIGIYIPRIEWHWIADLMIRSIVITIIFVVPLFYFNLAPDIREWTYKHLKKIGIKIN